MTAKFKAGDRVTVKAIEAHDVSYGIRLDDKGTVTDTTTVGRKTLVLVKLDPPFKTEHPSPFYAYQLQKIKPVPKSTSPE